MKIKFIFNCAILCIYLIVVHSCQIPAFDSSLSSLCLSNRLVLVCGDTCIGSQFFNVNVVVVIPKIPLKWQYDNYELNSSHTKASKSVTDLVICEHILGKLRLGTVSDFQ